MIGIRRFGFSFFLMSLAVSSGLPQEAMAQPGVLILSQNSASDYFNCGYSNVSLGNYQQAIADFSQPQAEQYVVKVSTPNGCINLNLREEPSMNAKVISCLPSGTNIAPRRIPPTGKFAWVKDQSAHLWYQTSVPGIGVDGWIMPDCTNIFDDPDQKACSTAFSAA